MGNGLSLPHKNLVVRRLGLPQNAGMDDPLSHSPRENVSRHMLSARRSIYADIKSRLTVQQLYGEGGCGHTTTCKDCKLAVFTRGNCFKQTSLDGYCADELTNRACREFPMMNGRSTASTACVIRGIHTGTALLRAPCASNEGRPLGGRRVYSVI